MRVTKIEKQMRQDYGHYILRYPYDEESRIIALMCIKDYENFSEQEIRNIVGIEPNYLQADKRLDDRK